MMACFQRMLEVTAALHVMQKFILTVSILRGRPNQGDGSGAGAGQVPHTCSLVMLRCRRSMSARSPATSAWSRRSLSRAWCASCMALSLAVNMADGEEQK